MSLVAGGIFSIGVTVFALWTWVHSPDLSVNAARPDIASLAVRSAAIGLIAISQLVLLSLVVGNLFVRKFADDLMKLLSLSVTAIAFIAALALGLASQ